MIWLLAILGALASPTPAAPGSPRVDAPLRRAVGSQPMRIVLEGEDARALARQARAVPGVHVEVAVRGQVQLTAPPTAIPALTALPGLRRARPPFAAHAFDVTSQGVDLMLLQDWHALGLTGQGVKIAVLDAGFQGYQTLLGTELPSSVGLHCHRADSDCLSSAHGTAVAELVHDFAPDAQIDLFGALYGSEWLAAADAIAQGGYDVVTCSIGFGNWLPGDGTAQFASKVDQVVDQTGTLWFQAAGNENVAAWTGLVTDTDHDGWLEMDGQEEIPILVWDLGNGDKEAWADLRWDDPWGEASDDIDLVLVAKNANGNDATCSWSSYTGDDVQSGGANDIPWEEIDALCPSTAVTFALELKVQGGDPTGHRVWLVNYKGLDPSWWTNQRSIATPGDARKALTVGAVGINDLGVRVYSGRGPTDDGRIKPDLMGPSAVDTSSWPAFGGTSAATPQVAGLAALVVQDARGHGVSRPQLVQWLIDQATDFGDPGPDNAFGWGLPQLDTPWFPADTGTDTGTTDTGATDTGTTDTGSDTGTTDTGSDTGSDTGELPPIACGCATGSPASAAWLLWLPALAFVRRRRA